MSRKEQKKEPIVVAQIMGKWVGGGVEAVIMNYYRHIDRSKVQFDFICDEDSTNIPYEEIEKLGGKVILCPPYQKLGKYMKFLENLFREKKYRIVHSNVNTLSVFPLRAAKKAGVPVRVAHSHSTSNPKEWKKNLLKNVLRPFSRKYATDYFACSELAGRYLFGDKLFDSNEVRVIHNAIDVEKYKFDPEARKRLRKEIGLKDDDFVIGHTGRFVQQKNHEFLIKVFSEAKKERADLKLVLVGQGPLQEKMKQKVAKFGLENDVFFLGQREDVEKVNSVFDVFCLPSIYEGLGVAALEAHVSGAKVLLSDCVPHDDAFKNATYYPLSEAQWKKAFLRIERNATRKTDAIDANYDLNKKAKELERIYLKKSVLGAIVFCEKWQNGGIESYLAKTMSRMGRDYEITIVSGQKETDVFDKYVEANNVSMLYLHDLIKNPIRRTMKNMLQFHKMMKGIDGKVIYLNIYNATGLLYARMARKNNTIIHAHNNGIDAGGDRLHIKRFANKILRAALPRKQYKYLACSRSAAFFCFGKKYANHAAIVKNGIDRDEFAFDCRKRKAIRRKYDIDDKVLVLGNIGRFVEQKNHHFMIDIISRLNKEKTKAKLMLIGQGPLRKEIERMVIEKNISQDVIFVDKTDNAGDYYSAMDVFIFPSLYEGQGIVLVEAQCEGLPCIASKNVPSITKITNNVEYLELDCQKWVDSIRKINMTDRSLSNSAIDGTDYDIKNTVDIIKAAMDCREGGF